MRMKKFTNLLIICALMMGIQSLKAQETVTYSDDFSYTLNFLTTAIPDSLIWEAYEVNAGINETQDCELNALKTESGALRFESYSGNYENDLDDGPFLYRTVPGGIDFDARVCVTGGDFVSLSGRATFLQHNSVGILAILTGDDYAVAQDFLYAMLFEAWSIHHMIKSIDDGVQTELTVPLTSYASLMDYPWIRLTRVGNLFTAYTSADGTTWFETVSVERADMEGLDLHVGLTQCNFTTISADEVDLLTPGFATGILDDFSLTHEKVASVKDIHSNGFKVWSQNKNVVIESENNELIQSSKLYTIDGRMIASQDHVSDLRCEFKNLRSGMYIVSTEIGRSTQARKVVVR
jgi:hypothetical protein